jgi:Holliday junction resolvase RusA-like endonuclease
MIRLTLDTPPSANRYWRNVNGHMVRSREASDYKDYVALLCRTAGMEPLDGDVRINLAIYRPARRGDLDNYLKVAIDSLIGYAYLDDSQIAEIHATRHEDKLCPRIEIEVTSL